MRAAAGRSCVNMVERVMSVLNVAAQGLARDCTVCADDTETVLTCINSFKQLLSQQQMMPQTRTILSPTPTATPSRFHDPILKLEHAYPNMTWSGNPIMCMPPSMQAQ